jgi:hypothetical protein
MIGPAERTLNPRTALKQVFFFHKLNELIEITMLFVHVYPLSNF